LRELRPTVLAATAPSVAGNEILGSTVVGVEAGQAATLTVGKAKQFDALMYACTVVVTRRQEGCRGHKEGGPGEIALSNRQRLG
jgi:hypothetical protein